MAKFPGPNARRFLDTMNRTWKQGQHGIITGGTGSGKTLLARHVCELRAARTGGTHLVFMFKLSRDDTITDHYRGYTRWTQWKKKPRPDENRILLWPDLSSVKGVDAKVRAQAEIFSDALDQILDGRGWTVQIDEGLYAANQLGLKKHLDVMYIMGRSSNTTMVTLAQRPSHLPLSLYANSTFSFTGPTQLETDLKRLSELGGKESARKRSFEISSLDKYDFQYIGSLESGLQDQVVNLGK